jgi:hypothetical protein
MRMRKRVGFPNGVSSSTVAVAVIAAMVGLTMLAFAGGPAVASRLGVNGETAARKQTSLSRFPLWSLLPTRRFATLGEALVAGERWGAYVYGRGTSRKRWACLEIVTARRLGSGGQIATSAGGEECASIQLGSVRPAIAEADLGQAGSVLAVLSPRDAVEVELQLSPGPDVVRRAKHLNPSQASKANVPKAGYAVLAAHQPECLERALATDRVGDKVFETALRRCDEDLGSG